MTKQTETKYKIRNWAEYNRALIQRGSINLWFSEDSIDKWHSTPKGNRGRPQIYSDEAILCALLIRTVYHLPLRALQGFLWSIIKLLGLSILTPSYTQICRRAVNLGKLLKNLSSLRPHDIVFDSTGLKVYGEGEWKVRQHGISKRRTWRKFHIGIDPNSGEIIVAELTENGAGCGDGETAERLIKKMPSGVKRVFGDGGYDGIGFRRKIEEAGAEAFIPPPKGAVINESEDSAMKKRNIAVLEITGLGGDDEARKIWKKLKGYHIRSLVETAMYRIKQLTGDRLKSRKKDSQISESRIRCLVINQMTRLGMPDGYWRKVS